jgi:hypothetical protein
MEFILTLAVISPLFYARGRASFKHGGGVPKSSEEQKKKMKKEKIYDEKKRKVRKIGRIK